MAAKAVNIRDTGANVSTNVASIGDTAQRARDNQVIDFSREVHMSAQAMGNSIQKYTAKKSFSGNFKGFPRCRSCEIQPTSWWSPGNQIQ